MGLGGVILAGGESRRMGEDKVRLPWGATTLLAHVIETLRPVVDELLVVVSDVRRVDDVHARVVQDLVPGAHALGGLYTGLCAASPERCFVCACDMPFLSPRLIRRLADEADGYDAVVLKSAGGLQPLHAVYAKSALPAIEAHLRSQQRDLRAVLSKVRVKVLEPARALQDDPTGLSAFNLNTPEDYRRACAMRETLTRIIDSHAVSR